MTNDRLKAQRKEAFLRWQARQRGEDVPIRKAGPAQVPTVDAFWNRVDVSGDCWDWTGTIHVTGYGTLSRGAGVRLLAHRLSWEMHRGPIPDGLFVCHHCDNRKCVRPDHLFLGTQADNLRDMRSKGRGRRPSSKARCINGHAFTPENTYIWRNERMCRECHRERNRAYQERKLKARRRTPPEG